MQRQKSPQEKANIWVRLCSIRRRLASCCCSLASVHKCFSVRLLNEAFKPVSSSLSFFWLTTMKHITMVTDTATGGTRANIAISMFNTVPETVQNKLVKPNSAVAMVTVTYSLLFTGVICRLSALAPHLAQPLSTRSASHPTPTTPWLVWSSPRTNTDSVQLSRVGTKQSCIQFY